MPERASPPVGRSTVPKGYVCPVRITDGGLQERVRPSGQVVTKKLAVALLCAPNSILRCQGGGRRESRDETVNHVHCRGGHCVGESDPRASPVYRGDRGASSSPKRV